MGIPLNVDWQQILLHLFNFIILFGGLWLLLYKPVKNFMAKREAYYKDMDKAAAEKLAAAENEQQKYSGLIGKAQDEAAELKKKAMADATPLRRLTLMKPSRRSSAYSPTQREPRSPRRTRCFRKQTRRSRKWYPLLSTSCSYLPEAHTTALTALSPTIPERSND